jgi:uncharacterized Rmd1/YagE family protein
MMIKLTISHAFAQSAKLTLFEALIEETIESTKHIPTVMAETGKIHMHRKAINKKIGQVLFIFYSWIFHTHLPSFSYSSCVST